MIKVARRPLYFVVLLFCLYLFYGFLVHQPWKHQYSDMRGYVQRALNLANNEPANEYDTFYPAGMTYLYSPLFILFPEDVALRLLVVLQALLLAGLAYLVFLFMRDFFCSERVAWWAMIFCGFYYPFIAFTGFYLSEIPFAFFMVLSCYLIARCLKEPHRMKLWVWAGFVSGFALLVRSVLLLGFALMAFIVWRRYWSVLRKYKKQLLVFSAVFILVVFGQVWRNSHILKKFTFLSTNGGIGAYLGQARVKKTTNIHPKGVYYFYNNNCYFDKDLVKEVTFKFGVWEDKKFMNEVFKLWKKDPLRQFKISINSAIDLFALIPHWPARNVRSHGKVDHVFQYIYLLLIYIPLLVLFLYKKRFKKYDYSALFKPIIYAPIVGVIFTVMLTKGEPRYLVPFQYLLVLLAAPFWVYIEQRFSKKKRYSSHPFKHIAPKY